ncbi:aminopeptidase N [Nocardioides dongxiaopingii]|uniref:aminopeptidase N n=1 Tax=Nocardioides sp. S-1144 TaxID=2582905 RepID=UPI00110F02D1|nr:aminopeptidase N [Nocardioides sp. S-1144]QCW51447.1 aminopeptidase N [Nocardioides sp. S-1144]
MSLTLDEARTRAAAVSEVSYDLDLDLTDPARGDFGLVVRIGFTCSAATTFLELTAATDVVVTLDGRTVDPAYDGRRLHLAGLGGTHEVVVDARVPLVTDGDGMHTFTDPADGATYVSAYLGMDVAQKVFACFDQNDLKAPVSLAVTADPSWTVVANGRVTSHDPAAGRWTFATTKPIPVAMWVVCAGPWHSRRWEHAGLPFAWHARASLAAELDRDFDELRRTTQACFDHYAELFAEPMPFDSYEQAFVPGQNWGALETPGCVTYRDEYLPRGVLPERMRASRATTIAHEMAHMWFGDLVTMTWWEDTWLQESFADYMGYRVAEAAAGYPHLLVGFETTRKVAAYRADARRSTHPVAPAAEDVPDVDAAATNFDMISYAKGNASLRQLVTWLGDETFLDGVNGYLSRHAFGNTTLADFVAALDAASDRDAVAWADAWLRTSGFDTIRVERDADATPVLRRLGSRPHRLRVASYDGAGGALTPLDTVVVDLADEPVRLEGWAGRVVLPNVGSETYAQVDLDEASMAAFADGLGRLEDPLARAVVWGQWFDGVRTRRIDPLAYLDVVTRHLPGETHPMIVTSVVSRTLASVLPERVPAEAVRPAVDDLAATFAAGLGAATTDELRLTFVEALASTSRDVDLLTGWLDADGVEHGDGRLAWYAALRWRVVARLAAIGGADAAFVEAERRRDGTVDGELGAARALAARPTREAKEAAWAAATEPGVANRRFGAVTAGLWDVEQVDLLAPFVDRYLDEAPGLAERGQAFAQAVGHAFPAVALSTAQLDAVEARAGDVRSSILRRAWEDALDDRR